MEIECCEGGQECELLSFIKVIPIDPFTAKLAFVENQDTLAFLNEISNRGFTLNQLQESANNLLNADYIMQSEFSAQILNINPDTITLDIEPMKVGIDKWRMYATTNTPLGGELLISQSYNTLSGDSGFCENPASPADSCPLDLSAWVCSSGDSNYMTVSIYESTGPFTILIVYSDGYELIENYTSTTWSGVVDQVPTYVWVVSEECELSIHSTYVFEFEEQLDDIDLHIPCENVDKCVLLEELIIDLGCLFISEKFSISITSPDGKIYDCRTINDEFCAIQGEGTYTISVVSEGEIFNEIAVNVTLENDCSYSEVENNCPNESVIIRPNDLLVSCDHPLTIEIIGNYETLYWGQQELSSHTVEVTNPGTYYLFVTYEGDDDCTDVFEIFVEGLDCEDPCEGIICDDGNACTFDSVIFDSISNSCICNYELDQNDPDGDGEPNACDPNDFDPCVNTINSCDDILCENGHYVNELCDDGNPCTINDRIDSSCGCKGEIICELTPIIRTITY